MGIMKISKEGMTFFFHFVIFHVVDNTMNLVLNFLACYWRVIFFTKIYSGDFFNFSSGLSNYLIFKLPSFGTPIESQSLEIFSISLLICLTGFLCDLNSIPISLSLILWNSSFFSILAYSQFELCYL